MWAQSTGASMEVFKVSLQFPERSLCHVMSDRLVQFILFLSYYIIMLYLLYIFGYHIRVLGHAMAQFVEALRYKPEGGGFDSRWCRWDFSLMSSFRPHYNPAADSASNRNEYQEYFLGGKSGRWVGLTTLPPSCADCLEFWEPQPPGTLRACRHL